MEGINISKRYYWKKIRVVLLVLAFALTWFLLVLAISNNRQGNMTIYVDKTTAKKTLSLSESNKLTNPTGKLYGPAITNAWDQDPGELPEYSDLLDGDQSKFEGPIFNDSPGVNKFVGQNYIAYTFYLFNSGEEELDYTMKFNIDFEEKDLASTLRVRLYEDGSSSKTTYGKHDDRMIMDFVEFESDKVIFDKKYENFKPGQVRKYSFVIYIDKNDPDTTNDKIGGALGMSVQFKVVG